MGIRLRCAPPKPARGTGAPRAQWAKQRGGASGIARSAACGATMRVPRNRPSDSLHASHGRPAYKDWNWLCSNAPSPGRSPWASLRPPGAAHGSPSQVQCCTLAGITSKRKSLQKQPKRRKPRLCLGLLLFGIRQRPTLPGRLQPSTIGAERLNFCVRYGNRWIPFAIVTGMLSRVCAVLRLLGFRDVHFKPSLLSWRRSAHLALLSSIARTLKTAHPDFFPSCLTSFFLACWPQSLF